MLFAYKQQKARSVNSTLISLQFYFKNSKEEGVPLNISVRELVPQVK
jgi:hypothetical protein